MKIIGSHFVCRVPHRLRWVEIQKSSSSIEIGTSVHPTYQL